MSERELKELRNRIMAARVAVSTEEKVDALLEILDDLLFDLYLDSDE